MTTRTKHFVTVEDALASYADAKNRHDVPAIIDMCADDCWYASVGMPGRVEGKEALAGFYSSLFEALPDYRGSFTGQAFSGDTAVTWGRFSGTMTGEYLGIPPTGRSVDVPVVFVCTFRGGLLTSDTGYFDAATFWEQAGIDPTTVGMGRPAPAGGLDHRGEFWLDRFRTAWEASDLDSLLAPLEPDCVVFYPPMDEATDRDGLRAFFTQVYSVLPDFTIRPLCWAQSEDDILIEWRGSGTVGDERLEWFGCDRFHFDEAGRIVEARAYWDPREVLAKVVAAGHSTEVAS